MSATIEALKDLAGPLYDELIESKAKAMARLLDPASSIRIAAINICDVVWHCLGEPVFVNTCRTIAAADPDDSVRVHAIGAFGRALRSSQDHPSSQFLANLVRNKESSEEVRMAAYWALREVQLGLTDEDCTGRSISLIKLASRRLQKGITPEQHKRLLLGGAGFPKAGWDSVDQIDWDFVDRYASEGVSDPEAGA